MDVCSVRSVPDNTTSNLKQRAVALGASSPRYSWPTQMSNLVQNSDQLVSLSESDVQQFRVFRQNSRCDLWWLRANFMLFRPRGGSTHTSSCHHLTGVWQGNLDLRLHPNKTAQRTNVNGKPSVWLFVTSRSVAKGEGFATESELSLRLISTHDLLVY